MISSVSIFVSAKSITGITSFCNEMVSSIEVSINSGLIKLISSCLLAISAIGVSTSTGLVIETLVFVSSSSSKRLNSFHKSKFGKNSFHVEFIISSSFSSCFSSS